MIIFVGVVTICNLFFSVALALGGLVFFVLSNVCLEDEFGDLEGLSQYNTGVLPQCLVNYRFDGSRKRRGAFGDVVGVVDIWERERRR